MVPLYPPQFNPYQINNSPSICLKLVPDMVATFQGTYFSTFYHYWLILLGIIRVACVKKGYEAKEQNKKLDIMNIYGHFIHSYSLFGYYLK